MENDFHAYSPECSCPRCGRMNFFRAMTMPSEASVIKAADYSELEPRVIALSIPNVIAVDFKKKRRLK